MISMKRLADAFSAFFKKISEVMEQIKKLFERISLNIEKRKNRSMYREKWLMVWDNRRESQVINRRPFSFVRKVM